MASTQGGEGAARRRRARPLTVPGARGRPAPPPVRRAVVSSHPTPESLFRLVQPSIGVSTRASFTALVGSMPSVVLGRSRLARRQERSQRAWVNLGLPQPSGPGAGWEDLAVSASQYGDIGGDDSDVLIYTAARVKYSRELVRRAGYAW